MGVMKNKESVLGGSLKKKGAIATPSSAIRGSYQHLEVDPQWNKLSKKEKQFCGELNMKPSSYCTLKRSI